MDRANPHRHRTFHDRESASILSAQRRGRMRMMSFWKNDNAIKRSVLTAELSHPLAARSRLLRWRGCFRS
jgi:hypothetical protein